MAGVINSVRFLFSRYGRGMLSRSLRKITRVQKDREGQMSFCLTLAWCILTKASIHAIPSFTG